MGEYNLYFSAHSASAVDGPVTGRATPLPAAHRNLHTTPHMTGGETLC